MSRPVKEIPEDKLWYLLLDKSVHKHNNPNYFDTFDLYGQKTIEENGYLEAMKAGWGLMIESVDEKEPLSSNLLLDIHERVRPRMEIPEEYRWEAPEFRPPNYRAERKAKGFSGMGIYSISLDQSETLPRCTEAAKKEWHAEKLIFDVCDGPLCNDRKGNHSRFKITDPEIHNQYLAFLIRGTDPDMSSHFPSVEDFLNRMHKIQLDRELKQDELKKLAMHFNQTRYEVTQEKSLNRIISLSGLPVGQFEQKRKVIELANDMKRPLIDKLIAEYNQNLNEALDDEKKLLAIVRFIRKISIVHPFADCNQRVFVFLILNKLLLENNFSPVILENPYVFDGYLSAAELVQEVKQGFKNFLKIVHGDEIPEKLISSAAFFKDVQIDLKKYPHLGSLMMNKIDLSNLKPEQLTQLNNSIEKGSHIADLIRYKHLTVEEACNLTALQADVLSNQEVYQSIVQRYLIEQKRNIPISDILNASDDKLQQAFNFVNSPERKKPDEYTAELKKIFQPKPSAALDH